VCPPAERGSRGEAQRRARDAMPSLNVRWVGRMPITPYLQPRAFEPETTKAMGLAFEKACRRLGLSLTRDAMTESVAKVIIALAERGESDAERLYEGALAHFGKAD
jgi:hypothetical protein